MKKLREILSEESGQGLVEYSLIISLVALVAIVAVNLFQVSVNDLYKTITDIMIAL